MFDKKEYNRLYRESHKQELKEYLRAYHEAHKQEQHESCRIYYQANKQTIFAQRRLLTAAEHATYDQEKHKRRDAYYRGHNQIQRKQKMAYMSIRRQHIKAEVLTHYGNGKLVCVRCGYDDVRALSIDHMNGGGGAHRKTVGADIYLWLKRYNYPEGFQTLCANCNWIKRVEEMECHGAGNPIPNHYPINHKRKDKNILLIEPTQE